MVAWVEAGLVLASALELGLEWELEWVASAADPLELGC